MRGCYRVTPSWLPQFVPHGGDNWPSYPGPDPIAAMVPDGHKHLVLTIHKVTDLIDGGEFVTQSHRVPIPKGINAVEMHRITWPSEGRDR